MTRRSPSGDPNMGGTDAKLDPKTEIDVHGRGCRCARVTSALAVRQAGRVLDHIAQARDQGQAIILITHNFRHALSVADDLTVLAQGRVAANFRRDEIDLDELTDLVAQIG